MDALNRKSIEEFQRSEKHPIVVVLENIRSMHNVGSVFRSADAFLIESVCLTGYTPCPPHRDINKTALGATETVSWKYLNDTKEAIQEFKNAGYLIYGVEQTTESIPVQKMPFLRGQKIVLIFGNEANGVEEETLKLCDGSVEIPQFGMKHSLNVSVAAGIVLWECVRKMHLNTN